MKNYFAISFLFIIIISLFFCKSEKIINDKIKTVNSFNKAIYTQTYIDAQKNIFAANYSKAISLYENCISQNPDIASPYFEIYKLLPNNNIKKYEYLVKAYELDKLNKIYAHEYAINLLNSGSDKGFEILENLIDNDNSNQDYILELANYYNNIKKYSKAASTLEKIGNFISIPPNLQYEIYKLYKDDNNEKEANRVLNILDKLNNNNNNELLNLQGNLEFDKGNLDNSLNYYKKYIASSQTPIKDKLIIFNKFFSLKGEDNLVRSKELLEIMKEINPNDLETINCEADYLYITNQKSKSRELYLKLLPTANNRFIIINKILNIDIEEDNKDNIMSDCNTAIMYYPQQANFYYLKAITLTGKEKYEDAINEFNNADMLSIEDEKLKIEIYKNIAYNYHKLQKHKESDLYFEKALKINGLDPNLLNNYSYFLALRNEQLDYAKEMSIKSLNIEPNNHLFLDTYSWILYKNNEFEEAEIWIIKSIKSQENCDNINHYGDILMKLNKIEKAKENWRNAISKFDCENISEIEQKLK